MAVTQSSDASEQRLDEQIEQKAKRVKELELEADRVHKQAQQLNKEGRFEEAQVAYARMHTLEDEASKLAQEVGCVACVLGDPSCGAGEVEDPAELENFFTVHPLPPWPQGYDPSQLEYRAIGAVVGSLVGDAAAMGVHWIYDLGVLDQLAAERAAAAAGYTNVQSSASAQKGDNAAETSSNLSSEVLTHPNATSDAVAVEVSKLEQMRLSVYANHDQTKGAHLNAPQEVESTSLASASTPQGSASGNHASSSCSSSTSSTQGDASLIGLEFMEPPRSPFYHYPTGRNSPYGEQTLMLLRSLSQAKGLDCIHYAHTFATYFGDGFDGYRDVSTKGFLRNFSRGAAPPQTGAPDAQANCIARVAPLVAAFAGHEKLMTAVRCATRVTQNSDAACAWAATAAAVLERVVLGSTPSQAVQETVQELRAAVQAGHSDACRLATADLTDTIIEELEVCYGLAALPVQDAVAKLGRNCHMPNAFTTPLHAALHQEHLVRQTANTAVTSSEEDILKAVGGRYAEGVRAAIREGGCCASRASYTGALLGAAAGVDRLPSLWRDKYSHCVDVFSAAQTMAKVRSGGT